MYVKLREIPIPRSLKVVVWVDDEPENNFNWIREVESLGISVVICTSTEEAIFILENYSWLLSIDGSDFRVVTDMVRLEKGKWNYTAGIDLITSMREQFQYHHKILIYCKDTKKASEAVQGFKEVYVTAEVKALREFLNYKEPQKRT
jgi:ubiquitin C